MSDIIISFFRENGSPKTGLTPTIDIWEKDGTHTVNGAAMTEIAGGFYYYDFTAYDTSKDYVIRTDGGATLEDYERYQSGANEMVAADWMLKIIKNKKILKRVANTWYLIVYDDDGTTEILNKELQDKNGNDISTIDVGILAKEIASSV
jgi:hypothetical protein